MRKAVLCMTGYLALVGIGFAFAQTTAVGSSGAGATGERFALVIGNGGYTGMPALKNPVNDARDVAGVLKRTGCAVDLLLDADIDAMEAGVNRLAVSLKATPGRVGIFYYAGHGVQSNGENYLIPIGAQING